MPNFKDQLNHYMQQKESQVELDAVLKQTLHAQLTNQPAKRRTWWKLSLPILAIGVLGGIIFTLKQTGSNHDSVTTIIANSLRPQEALAAALENSINPEIFDRTLGLPDDGQFHHRLVSFAYNYPTPNEADLGAGRSNFEIWSDGMNVRADEIRNTETPERTTYTDSTLMNSAVDQFCLASTGNEAYCVSIDAQQHSFDSILDEAHGWLKSVDHETYVTNFTAKRFSDDGYPGITFSWSTASPMTVGIFNSMNLVSGSGQGGTVTSTGEHEGLYDYEFKLYNRDLSGSSDLYVQISNEAPTLPNGQPGAVLSASMIYKIQPHAETLQPVNTETFLQTGRERNIGDGILVGGYTTATEPLRYALQNLEAFSEPMVEDNLAFHEQTADRISFILPLDYLYQTSLMLGGAADHEGLYTIHFYLDQTDNTKLLGYTITNGTTTVVEMSFTDEVLSVDEAANIFDISSWKTTFDQ